MNNVINFKNPIVDKYNYIEENVLPFYKKMKGFHDINYLYYPHIQIIASHAMKPKAGLSIIDAFICILDPDPSITNIPSIKIGDTYIDFNISDNCFKIFLRKKMKIFNIERRKEVISVPFSDKNKPEKYDELFAVVMQYYRLLDRLSYNQRTRSWINISACDK